MVEALSHSFVVIAILVTFDNLHLDEGHLVARASAQDAQIVANLLGEFGEVTLVKLFAVIFKVSHSLTGRAASVS